MLDESFLRGEVEPYIDSLYLRSSLLKRHRDTAAMHLLRVFEDATRFRTISPVLKGRLVQFYITLRWSHEAIPWALRWVWNDCPHEGAGRLDFDEEVYGEAVELMRLGFAYYHLYRCFVLYSRGYFRVETHKEQKRIQFFFRSEAEEKRDAALQLYSIVADSPPVPMAVRGFLEAKMPVIRTIFPHYFDKTGELSIRYEISHDMLDLFKQWAELQVRYMRFDMPGAWKFGHFTLQEFRNFWMSLLSIALAHITAHNLADETVGTKGGAIGTAIMQLNDDAMMKMRDVFPVPRDAWRTIADALTYQPTRTYWDLFWQPIIKTSDGTFLISPHLIAGSSPERNLITSLNRTAAGRKVYNQVSAEKEKEQLVELEKLFGSSRYISRPRVPVHRDDGTILTDIDLVICDQADQTVLLIHAKWLIRPDFITEVLAKDEEVISALGIVAAASVRINELGSGWLSTVVGLSLGEPLKVYSVIVNQDFVPSGWVHDKQIAAVDMKFVKEFVESSRFTGLASFVSACVGFDDYLQKEYPVTLSREDTEFGDYVFELPMVKPTRHT